jgi:hypothetical protein
MTNGVFWKEDKVCVRVGGGEILEIGIKRHVHVPMSRLLDDVARSFALAICQLFFY